MKRLIFIALVLIAGCHKQKPVGAIQFNSSGTFASDFIHAQTETVGQRCDKMVVSGDETYLMDNLVCVEMHKITRKDELSGWTYAYIIGTRSEAAFKEEEDAEEWARSQPYVRRTSQKH